jgi:hypothetical protein
MGPGLQVLQQTRVVVVIFGTTAKLFLALQLGQQLW